MKNPGKIRAQTCSIDPLSLLEALRFNNSTKSPSTWKLKAWVLRVMARWALHPIFFSKAAHNSGQLTLAKRNLCAAEDALVKCDLSNTGNAFSRTARRRCPQSAEVQRRGGGEVDVWCASFWCSVHGDRELAGGLCKLDWDVLPSTDDCALVAHLNCSKSLWYQSKHKKSSTFRQTASSGVWHFSDEAVWWNVELFLVLTHYERVSKQTELVIIMYRYT